MRRDEDEFFDRVYEGREYKSRLFVDDLIAQADGD